MDLSLSIKELKPSLPIVIIISANATMTGGYHAHLLSLQ